MALALIPITVVVPLGILSVLVTSILGAFVLKEKYNLVGQISGLLCLLGSLIIIIHAPKVQLDFFCPPYLSHSNPRHFELKFDP